MPEQPIETLTFLFTDIEGSTKLWQKHPNAMKSCLARHDVILRAAIEGNHGEVFKTVGDAFYGVFTRPEDAVAAALRMQYELLAEDWGEVGSIRVRVAINTGEAERRSNDYFGMALNLVSRLLSAGHGGQILLSSSSADPIAASLTSDVSLRDMGERRLKDVRVPTKIFQLLAPGLRTAFPPLVTLDQRPNNLPSQLTPLVGREREIEEGRQRLQRPNARLLTLTGPGGIGKTRLGLQIAADLIDDSPDGVFFVDLSPVRDARLVASTIADVLGVKEAGKQPLLDTLKAYLREKRLLLVLDNFERVMPAATLVGELLAAAPSLKFVVTSRSMLRLYGEQNFPVPPLGLPDRKRMPPIEQLASYEAIRLFIQRAMDVSPDFQLTGQTAQPVVEICHRLDGLPLAIELAAARIGLLQPQAMLAKLESRMKVLTGGARNLPARQRTLRGTIAWSYDLLSPDEQKLFQRLSVFLGGCTLEAATAVCAESDGLEASVAGGLSALVDNSLLRREGEGQQDARFVMLETIREYGQECLDSAGETGNLQSQHARFFVDLAEKAEPELTGAGQVSWLKRLETEHDNLRGSLRWTIDSKDADLALRISASLQRFWSVRGHLSEGRSWLERSLALSKNVTSQLRARALRGAGNLAWRQADFASARRFHEQSLAISRQMGNKWEIASTLNNMANVTAYQGEYTAAGALLHESLGLYRELGDKTNIAVTLTNLGVVEEHQGEFAAARALYEESLSLCRELGDTSRIALNLYNLGTVVACQGEFPAAQAYCLESLAISRELEDNRNVAFALSQLAEIALGEGDFPVAGAYLKESLAIQNEVGDRRGVIQALVKFASLAASNAQFERAARLLGSVQVHQASIGLDLVASERGTCEAVERKSLEVLGEEGFGQACDMGRAMSLEEAVKYALGDA